MIQLDDDFLASLGLGDMPVADKELFLQHILEELEMRVGTELSKDLDDIQMVSFEKIIQDEDETQAIGWLEQNCPNYKDVVAAEIEKLRQEISDNKQQILGQA